ncbi:MAG TPA: hypothetical protein VMU95_30745, partial [Trebonia sp.]|nr:hypothetical protein [Trebonia sp.]
LRRSGRAVTGDARKPGVAEVGYARIPLRAAWSLRALGAAVHDGLDTVSVPVLLATSAHDHVVPSADGDAVWSGIPSGQRQRVRFADSYHLVPVDEDAQQLFSDSISFVRHHVLAARP